MISAFYGMILYFNATQFTPGERAGIGTCIAVMAVLSAVLYGVPLDSPQGVQDFEGASLISGKGPLDRGHDLKLGNNIKRLQNAQLQKELL